MTFQDTYVTLRGRLLQQQAIMVGTWHNVDVSSSRQHDTRELLDVNFPYMIPPTMEQLQREVRPNLPWAEDHFLERVSGEPLNPPPSEAWWPHGNTNTHKAGGQFSHTYPERFWPKRAGDWPLHPDRSDNWGIRYQYGDLGDVVDLLKRQPMTRQAVLPVFFPEDTGNTSDVRLPCSLHYQWLIREGKLRCTYSMRSVDFWRHFKDDVYLAARLTQWISDQLSPSILPGTLTMNIGSLHLLEGDVEKARSEAIHEAF